MILRRHVPLGITGIGKLTSIPPAPEPVVASTAQHIEQTLVHLLDTGDLERSLKMMRFYGIHLQADGDALRCRADPGTITPGLLAAIKAHKDGLIRLLAGNEKPR